MATTIMRMRMLMIMMMMKMMKMVMISMIMMIMVVMMMTMMSVSNLSNNNNIDDNAIRMVSASRTLFPDFVTRCLSMVFELEILVSFGQLSVNAQIHHCCGQI